MPGRHQRAVLDGRPKQDMTHGAIGEGTSGIESRPEMPLVSVVVPFWNVRSFLAEAIESVIAQTMPAWELLLVDDGSTDGSAQIARRYVERMPARIRYLAHERQQNRGVAASRNLGICHARASYVAFLDADDVWVPNKLARQMAILDAEPEAAMVCGPSLFWYSWTGKPQDSGRDHVKELRVAPAGLIRPPTLLVAYLRRGVFVANPSTILIRRQALERVNGFEESFIGPVQTWEDAAFLAKIHLSEATFVATECWTRYRRHDRSLLSVMTRSGHTRAGRLFYLRWLEAYLKEQQAASDEVWQALQAAFWPYRHPVLQAVKTAKASVSRRAAREWLARGARWILPLSTRQQLRAWWGRRQVRPAAGAIDFGALRRVTPIGRRLGRDRGLPIDRYYIERFLEASAASIRGRVLEIGDDRYTRAFGGDRVTRADVLHVRPDNPRATIVADLTCADELPAARFDCIILTQTLPFIHDIRAAIRTIYRILAPGGVVLATVSGITQIGRGGTDTWHYHWGFTTMSARMLFEEVFPPGGVTVEAYGNVLAATAFLHGLAAEDLRAAELAYRDPDYEFLVAIRAVKPGSLPADEAGADVIRA